MSWGCNRRGFSPHTWTTLVCLCTFETLRRNHCTDLTIGKRRISQPPCCFKRFNQKMILVSWAQSSHKTIWKVTITTGSTNVNQLKHDVKKLNLARWGGRQHFLARIRGFTTILPSKLRNVFTPAAEHTTLIRPEFSCWARDSTYSKAWRS